MGRGEEPECRAAQRKESCLEGAVGGKGMEAPSEAGKQGND